MAAQKHPFQRLQLKGKKTTVVAKPVATAVPASALMDAASALSVVAIAVAATDVVGDVVAATVVQSAVVSVAPNVAMNVVSSVLPTGFAQKAVPRVAPTDALKAAAVNAVNVVLKALARNVRNAQLVSSAMMRRAPRVNKAANHGQKVHAQSALVAKEVIALTEMTGLRRATLQSRTLH